MDVLQDAVRVVRDVDAEKLLHPGIPHLGEVLERDGAFDQLLLELEAQDDVEAVGRLVRVHTDEAGLGAVDRANEVVELDVAQVRERLLQRLEPVRPERAAAARRGSPTCGFATR